MVDEKLVELCAATQEVLDHFAAVMGNIKGVTFENGVEGIPTIARARKALSDVVEGR